MRKSDCPDVEGGRRGVSAAVRVAAILLLILAGAGAHYGLRAAAAQNLYRKTKFGAAGCDLRAIVNRCETARRLYPWNYYFPMWTAERAFEGDGAAALTADERRSITRHWCDVALALNGYRRGPRLIKTHLLRDDESLEAARRYWEAYVDWDFWDPFNQAVLVELYAAGGQIGKALRAYRWVERSEYAADCRRMIANAWRREAAPPGRFKGS